MRKASSLTSLSFGKMSRRNGGFKQRTRSFSRETKEIQEALIQQRIENDMKDLQRWVSEKPRKRRRVVPMLVDLAAVAAAKHLQAPGDVEHLQIARELKDAVEFRLLPVFDESLADPKISFSNGGRSIQYAGKGYSTTIMKTPFGRGLRHGRHAWIIYIDTSRVQGWMQIGVVDQARVDAKCCTQWDGNPHPFRKGEIARRNNGNFHSGRHESEATIAEDTIFLSGFVSGDTLSMKLDFDTKQLQWLKNGELYGGKVKFQSDILHPSISLDSPGEGVSLVYYKGPVAI